jgi:hypothetical protein
MVRQTNALFDTKTIKKFCNDIEITDKQREAAKEWLTLLEGKKLEDETKNYFRFGQIILQDVLGYQIKDIDFGRMFVFGDKRVILQKNSGIFYYSQKSQK